MAQKLEELPLFPLNAVLFPHAHTLLHVSEERDRELIRWCLNHDSKFGVVLTRNDSVSTDPDPYLIGTAAQIMKVETHNNGSMQVSVKGDMRFRIRELDESRQFLVGKVEPVEEEELNETPRASALTFRARECVQEYIQTVFESIDYKVNQITLPHDVIALSFIIANLLQIGNLSKQHLLETTDTIERLAEMIPVLEEMAERNTLPTTPAITKLQAAELLADISNN